MTSSSPRQAQGKAASRGNPPPPQPETSDYRHLIRTAQFHNMRGLGRDIPLGISLILNGDYRELMPNNQRPFDVFLDS